MSADMPLLETLLQKLEVASKFPRMPDVSITPDELMTECDKGWQVRIRTAGTPIPHYMGSFGPGAYNADHLEIRNPELGEIVSSFQDLARSNRSSEARSGSYLL